MAATQIQYSGQYMKAEILFVSKRYNEAISLYLDVMRKISVPIENRLTQLMIEKELDTRMLYQRLLGCSVQEKQFNVAETLMLKYLERGNKIDFNWLSPLSMLIVNKKKGNISWDIVFSQITAELTDSSDMEILFEHIIRIDS